VATPDPKVVTPDPKVVTPDPKVVTPDPKVVTPDPKVDVAVASGECPGGTVRIETGSFTFGSSPSDPMRNFGEADASSVEVKAFCIEHYEAPNGKSTLPTTGVSWTAAKNACERAGRRLCTEQEWERACKGPSSSRFPYGNTYDADTCNTEDADGKQRPLAAPVDFKKCRSGFKLYMMAGNAEEWVADSLGGQKIAKGGSADHPDFQSRCSARRVISAKTTTATLGYRCCATPK
jgi:formylglycine-generating enzyme required for sulfatase activity